MFKIMKISSFKNNQILLIGIGIFFLMAAESIGFFFQFTLKNLLLYVEGIQPLIIFLVSKLIYLFTFIAGLYFLLRVLEKNKFSFLRIIYLLFAGIVIGQLLQFLASFILFNFENENFYQNFHAYTEFNSMTGYIRVLDLVIWLMQPLILGWMLYENRNLVFGQSESRQIDKIGNSQ